MLAPQTTPVVEALTPHDIVAYYRCPHEMELIRASHLLHQGGALGPVRTPADVVPLHRSPLFAPPLGNLLVNEGRLDVSEKDLLVYEDDGEDDLPVLFPPDRVRPDVRFAGNRRTLEDPHLGLRGRPDLIIQRADTSLVPLEYKSTHLFVGYHEAHGRLFDTVQVIAECGLVEAAFERKVPYGIVLYGDENGGGVHEGWVRIPYGEAERTWLRVALRQIREDRDRAPVPAERNCGGCEPNSNGLCKFAASRYEGPHHRIAMYGTWRG